MKYFSIQDKNISLFSKKADINDDKTLLVAASTASSRDNYQTQISNELDKGIDAIECFTRDYKRRVILEEIEDFMSKNKKELLTIGGTRKTHT